MDTEQQMLLIAADLKLHISDLNAKVDILRQAVDDVDLRLRLLEIVDGDATKEAYHIDQPGVLKHFVEGKELVDFPTAIRALMDGHTIRRGGWKIDNNREYYVFDNPDLHATDWIIE